MRKFRKRPGADSGMTLVEMGVVLTISAIVLTGMLVAYTDGIRYWKSTSDEMTLYNEGTMALALMSKWIRNSNFVKIKSFSGLPNSKIELRYPDPSWSAEFYFVKQSGELKWNDQTEDRNKFNMKLLPAVNYRGTQPNEKPYLSVKDVVFTSLDDIGWGSPQLLGYSLIKLELVLESADGDTLYLSSVVSKRNK